MTRGLTAERDLEQLRTLDPGFGGLMRQVLSIAQDDLHGSRFECHIFEGHRRVGRQWKLYRKGRRQQPDGSWRKVGRTVTNAMPHQSPHCVYTPELKPAALACDFWIIDTKTRRLAPDAHPVWAVVPRAGWEAAGEHIAIGAAFRSIRGGDWPHIELATWRRWAPHGKLEAPWSGWGELLDELAREREENGST